MFAVPGWSISADALKIQTEPITSKATTVDESGHPIATDKKRSRKRKRGLGLSAAVEVTAENLGDLWKRHIEENALDQSQSKTKKKKRKLESDEKGHAPEKNENVDGGSFEGFTEDDKSSKVIDNDAPLKGKKKKRKENQTAHAVQANNHEDATKLSRLVAEEQVRVQDGKSKYEQRKAKASKKREQRSLLQANGTLPPTRPETVSSYPIKTTPANTAQNAKPPESSKASSTLQKPIMIEHREATKASASSEASRVPNATQAPALSIPATKLTPLQQRMAAKLTSARFRHLNQTLYTSPSDQAMRLFADSPQNYTSYHAGFRAQVAVWPQNPVEGFIEDIKARGMVSVPSQKKLWREQKKGKKPKGSNGDATTSTNTAKGAEKTDPLPRSPNGTCTIADLGCGDATLAGHLSPSAKSLNLKILSFDLAKGDTPNAHLITIADISNLSTAGVKDATVDIAICCLSLMGTNWVDVVQECARIVRGGEVWVAEIKSRFARPGVKKDKKKTEGGVGKMKKNKNKKGTGTGNGRNADDDDEEDDEPVAVEEVEEEDDARTKGRKDETDVGAFVEVFRKRGLVLKGEPDVGNKMFVKMRFAKSLGGGMGRRNEKVGRGKMFAKTRFLDDDDDVDDGGGGEVDESKVLKPCVYKTR